jgi:hypothetical protein
MNSTEEFALHFTRIMADVEIVKKIKESESLCVSNLYLIKTLAKNFKSISGIESLKLIENEILNIKKELEIK